MTKATLLLILGIAATWAASGLAARDRAGGFMARKPAATSSQKKRGRQFHATVAQFSVDKCQHSVEYLVAMGGNTLEASEWQYMKKLAQQLTRHFWLGPNESHMALLNGGAETLQALPFNDPAAADNEQVKEAIWSLSKLNGTASLSDTVQAAVQIYGAARLLPRVFVVISTVSTVGDVNVLQQSLDALDQQGSLIPIFVYFGDPALLSAPALQAIKIFTGCQDITSCPNFFRAKFAYPSIMLAQNQCREYTCAMLDMHSQVADR